MAFLTPERKRIRLTGGDDLAFTAAGSPTEPTRCSSTAIRARRAPLGTSCPPCLTRSMPPPPTSPASVTPRYCAHHRLRPSSDAIGELLDETGVGPCYVHLHDFGAPVGLHLVMQQPDRVLGFIQNANAHRSGFGPGWDNTIASSSDPSPRTLPPSQRISPSPAPATSTSVCRRGSTGPSNKGTRLIRSDATCKYVVRAIVHAGRENMSGCMTTLCVGGATRTPSRRPPWTGQYRAA